MVRNFLDTNKIVYHPDRLSSWLNENYAAVKPITVELHLSGRCNNNCYYCFDKSNKTGILMGKKDAIVIIDKLKQLGVVGIVLSGGGEPTMNNDLGEIIKYIHTNGMDVGLITNGVKIPVGLISIIAEHCTWVRVSYDSTNPDIYKKIRKTDNAIDVISNLKLLVAHKKKCTIGAQIVVNEYNLHDLWHTTHDLSKVGLDYLQIRPLENVEYDDYVLEYILNQLDVLKKIHGDWLVLSQKWDLIDQNISFNKCWCYSFIGTITVGGDMYICCHHINNKKYCYGNLIREDIVDIINKRDIVAKNINLKKCPKLCRGVGVNLALEKIKCGIEHVNFL